MARGAGPRGIEPRPRRFWRPAGHHDLSPTSTRCELESEALQGFPVAPAYRWPTTGLGLPAAGFLGAPGEFLIRPRLRADAGTDGRDEARQGMAPEQRVGHRIPHHRQSIVPISRFSST